MHDMEFGVLHWVKWVYGQCSDRELHLKGSLAMLIWGLQNPFVTRSISFQHEYVGTKLLSCICSICSLFLFIFILFSNWLLDKLMYLRNSFVQFSIQMIFWRLCCNISILCFCFDSGIRVASMSNVDSIPFPNRYSHIYMGVLILLDHRDL